MDLLSPTCLSRIFRRRLLFLLSVSARKFLVLHSTLHVVFSSSRKFLALLVSYNLNLLSCLARRCFLLSSSSFTTKNAAVSRGRLRMMPPLVNFLLSALARMLLISAHASNMMVNLAASRSYALDAPYVRVGFFSRIAVLIKLVLAVVD